MNDLKLEYNSTYLSLNLIDELDYVIGGYGKPNAIFLYSLNTFLEAFILNSKFYLSGQEAKHISIVSKAIFPHGRPVMELLSKTNSLMVIGGIGNEIGQVVSIGKVDPGNPQSYQEKIKHYIEHGLETEDTRRKYLVLPSLDDFDLKLKYLNIGRVEDGYVATESTNTPQQFYSKLCSVTENSNVQATMPFYSYSYQINEIANRGISKEIITKLSDSFQQKKKKVDEYFGFKNQSIPPLVSILFSQCKTKDQIPEKMLQLRNDYTNLRNSVVKYEERLNEADSIKDQLDAIDEINEFWSVLNKKYSEDTRIVAQLWELAEESGYENSIDNAIDLGDTSELLEDLNPGKVGGKGLKKALTWYKDKKIINRFRGVTDIWKLFENTPNVKKQLLDFERLFGIKISEQELSDLNNKINTIKLHTTKPKLH